MTDVACYYHDPIKGPLLRQAVLPALQVIADGYPTVTAHLERHWLHGPHVRVRLNGPEWEVGAAAAVIAQRLAEYVSAHPSTVAYTDADLLAQAELAGRVELIAPPYTPIHADNTVRVEATDTTALAALLGSEDAVDCRAHVLRLGLPTVAASLDRLGADDDSATARVHLAVTAMAAHAGRYPHGLGGGYQSFLSHVEDFLLHHDPDHRLRGRFDLTWQRHGEAMTGLVARVAGGQASDATEAAWLEWTVRAAAATQPAHDRGSLPRMPGSAYGERARALGDAAIARQWNHAERTEYSDYHRALQRVADASRPHARDLAVYRFTTNMLYLLLALCDITPIERYLAAYLVSQATEQVTGLSWQQRLDRIAATR